MPPNDPRDLSLDALWMPFTPNRAVKAAPRLLVGAKDMHYVTDDGRQVLDFRPSRWDRWCQQLEVTFGELLPDQPVPLLKRRLELSREEALKLWSEKRTQGWQPTKPQWRPPQAPAKE